MKKTKGPTQSPLFLIGQILRIDTSTADIQYFVQSRSYNTYATTYSYLLINNRGYKKVTIAEPSLLWAEYQVYTRVPLSAFIQTMFTGVF